MSPQAKDAGDLSGCLVLVVEDDAEVARAVASMLHDQGCRTRLAASAAEGQQALRTDFDAALLDLKLPDGSGLELLHAIRSTGSPLGVVIMTGGLDMHAATQGMRVGLTEYLRKPFRSLQLTAALSLAVASTRRWRRHLDEVVDAYLSEPYVKDAHDQLALRAALQSTAARLTAKGHLTPREHEVLALVLIGHRNVDIATRLQITVHTVKFHCRNALSKLGQGSRLELFRLLAQETMKP